jgi:hypothetical protein
MGMQTNRAKQLIKLIKRLLKQEHLYDSEKIVEMKKQLRILEQEVAELETKTSKGFGKK